MPDYRIFGFTVKSDIELPVLPKAVGRPHDVEFRVGEVPETAHLQTRFRNWEAEPDRFLGTFDGVGRFFVSNGNFVRYERYAGIDDSRVVSVLLGTCMTALLMQRRILPLHSCSVLTDGGALLVMGASGAGKSTMLGGLLSLGLPMMADDVTGIDISATGRPEAIPAFPATRLWADSLARLGHDEDGLPRVRDDMAKFYRAVSGFHTSAAPIRAIVHLQASNREDPEMHPIENHQRVECLSRYVHRKNFIDGMNLRRWAFGTATEVVRQVPMFRLIRPTGSVEPASLAQLVLDRVECDAERELAAS